MLVLRRKERKGEKEQVPVIKEIRPTLDHIVDVCSDNHMMNYRHSGSQLLPHDELLPPWFSVTIPL